MLSTGTSILVVEYQPQIIDITRLAAMSFRIDEQPVIIHRASNTREAATLLRTKLRTRQGISQITVALIALDLDTPGAGLELCRVIREELHIREMQIYLRLDNLQSVPERSLFDRYTIGGYYTSAEIAEDKLYSLLKTGVYYSRTLMRVRVFMQLAQALVIKRTKDGIRKVFSDPIPALEEDNTGMPHGRTDPRVAFLFDGEVVAKHRSLRDEDILVRWRSLQQKPGTVLSETGDKYTQEGEYFMVHVEARADCAGFSYLCPLTGDPPDSFVADFYPFARLAATLWKYAE